jgi:hypothetical protein
MYTTRVSSHRRRSPQPVSAGRDPWYEQPSEISVLPEQFFDSRVTLITVCPETALMYAVLEDAFLCYKKMFELTIPDVQRRAQEAEQWFFSDDSDWLFSFVSVCHALGLEPKYIRTKLKHWTPSYLDIASATR